MSRILKLFFCFANRNPKGVFSYSPGLRVSALPRVESYQDAQPQRGCLIKSQAFINDDATPLGLMFFSIIQPGVARIHATPGCKRKPLWGCFVRFCKNAFARRASISIEKKHPKTPLPVGHQHGGLKPYGLCFILSPFSIDMNALRAKNSGEIY